MNGPLCAGKIKNGPTGPRRPARRDLSPTVSWHYGGEGALGASGGAARFGAAIDE